MTTLREAVAQALDALTEIHPGNMTPMAENAWLNAVQILREALAEPEPEPLTDEEIYECERVAAIRHQRHKNSIRGQQITSADNPQWHFARAIERAHGIGEKNG